MVKITAIVNPMNPFNVISQTLWDNSHKITRFAGLLSSSMNLFDMRFQTSDIESRTWTKCTNLVLFSIPLRLLWMFCKIVCLHFHICSANDLWRVVLEGWKITENKSLCKQRDPRKEKTLRRSDFFVDRVEYTISCWQDGTIKELKSVRVFAIKVERQTCFETRLGRVIDKLDLFITPMQPAEQ